MKKIIPLILFSSNLYALDEQALQQRLQRMERQLAYVSELMLEVDQLKQKNRQLEGKIEELQYTLQKMEQKQKQFYLDLDDRLLKLESGGTPGEAQPATIAEAGEPATEPAPPPPAAPPLTSNDQQSMRAEYQAAYDLLKPANRRYQEAISAFQQFLQKYPRTDLSDNALYWLGEAYYVTHNNEQALASFNRLLREFPQSDKVPGALLKKGYILAAQRKKEEARAVLNQVVNRFPGTVIARMAQAKLRQLQ